MQKQFFLRLIKENNLYHNFNCERYDFFKSYLNSMYIDEVYQQLNNSLFQHNKKQNLKFTINTSILYDILPSYNHRIVIKNIINLDKLYNYFDENGIVWCSYHRPKDHTTFLNGTTPKYLCITRGTLSWASSEFWEFNDYYTYSFYTEETFYLYWESLKVKFRKNFNKILICKEIQ